MAATRHLVSLRGLRPRVAWAAVVVLVASALRLLTTGEPDWAAFVAIALLAAFVPTVRERDPSVIVPGELLALLAIPVVLRAAGVVTAAAPFFVMAGLALFVAVDLDAYTSLELTPRFAVVFVVVTTMAFTATWTVGTWASDVLFGTAFVAGRTELMWDIVAATAAGVVAGVVFHLYFRFADRVDRVDRVGGSDTGTGRSTGPDTAEATGTDGEAGREEAGGRPDPQDRRLDLPGDTRQQRLAVDAMRAVLALIAVVGAVRGNPGMFFNGVITIAVTFVPALLRREYDYPMDVGLTMWVTAAVFLHAVGVLGPYRSFGWYHSVTHALSATLIAGIGYALARAVELHTDAVDFDPTFRGVFVVLFVLAAGVAWELVEFASGGIASILGGRAALVQYGTGDIVNDLVFNALGGVVVAVLTTGRFEAVARRLAGRVGVFARRE